VPNGSDWKLYALASLILSGFFAAVGGLYFIKLPQENVSAVNQLLGALQAGFGGIVTYFFAGSIGSRKKDEMIAESLRRSDSSVVPKVVEAVLADVRGQAPGDGVDGRVPPAK
jgi:hypothetical protein